MNCGPLVDRITPNWEIFGPALERAVWAGEVAFFRIEREQIGWLPPLPGEEVGPGHGTAPPPKPATDTWFELRVVDEMGEPLSGVELLFGFDRQVHVTGADGRITIQSVPAQFHQTRVRTPPAAPGAAAAEAQPLDSLRAAVKPRWDQVRPGPWYEPRPDDVVVQLHGDTPIDISLLSERPRTIVVRPWVVRARFAGFYVNHGRCFLRPEGLADVRAALERWRGEAPSAALVVGHTSIGDDVARGDRLSLQRAEALLACLRHDVEAWLKHYELENAPDERWGPREDQLMLCALPDAESLIAAGDTIVAFQRSRSLESSGTMDQPTRRALVREYMGLCCSLPTSIVELETYGCGPHFPLDARDSPPSRSEAEDAPQSSLAHTSRQGHPDVGQDAPAGPTTEDAAGVPESACEALGDRSEESWPALAQPWQPPQVPLDLRRFEFYLFDAVLGPQPSPEGSTSSPGTRAYPEWEQRAQDRWEYRQPGDELPCHFSFVLYDEDHHPVANSRFALDVGANFFVRGQTDEAGRIELGDFASGDYALLTRGVTMVVPALNKAEQRRGLRLRTDGERTR
jgi:hypothetical protein